MAIIDSYPHIDLSFFKRMLKDFSTFQTWADGKPIEKVKEGFSKLREDYFTRSFSIGETHYKVSAEVDLLELELYGVVFEWEDEDGTAREQRINLTTRESNLHNGVTYYFVSPHGNLCRKLYFSGYRIFARTDIKHSYIVQHMSHQARTIRRGAEYNDPTREYGKTHYKGKLTPYGRKLQRYERASAALENDLLNSLYKTIARHKKA